MREAHRAAADGIRRSRIADASRAPEPRFRLAAFLAIRNSKAAFSDSQAALREEV